MLNYSMLKFLRYNVLSFRHVLMFHNKARVTHDKNQMNKKEIMMHHRALEV